MNDFKVGDVIMCTCGHESCTPFVITEIGDRYIKGVNSVNKNHLYTCDDFPLLRKLTKLEKALK